MIYKETEADDNGEEPSDKSLLHASTSSLAASAEPSHRATYGRQWWWLAVGVLLSVGLLSLLVVVCGVQQQVQSADSVDSGGSSLAYSRYSDVTPVVPGRTLIVFIHSENDEAHRDNLLHFIDKAVRCWQDADYVFIIQRDDADELTKAGSAAWLSGLPALPPNARYVLHENKCLDWGTAAWLLAIPPSDERHVNTALYRYFIIMNSSVRGPFLSMELERLIDLDHEVQCDARGTPLLNTSATAAAAAASAGSVAGSSAAGASRSRVLLSWFHVFLTRLSDDVKYVGCTISCVMMPHVQSYVVAFDYIALQLLWQVDGRSEEVALVPVEKDYASWHSSLGLVQLKQRVDGGVLSCPASYDAAIGTGELGASRTVLRSGYNIAVMERFWADVDFRLQSDACQRLPSPVDPSFDGVPYDDGSSAEPITRQALHPLDVVFIKRKHRRTMPHDSTLNAVLAWEQLNKRNRITQTLRRNNSLVELHKPILFQPTQPAAAPAVQQQQQRAMG